MENNFEIRLFNKDDRDRVNDFFDRMGGESRAFFNRGEGNRRGALNFFNGDDKKSIRWMMTDGDRMIGYVFLWDISKSVVWLGIALSDEFKGKKLGATLLSHAKNWAVENGKGGIMLTTHVANLRGQGLYERCDYERLGMHSSGEVMYILRW